MSTTPASENQLLITREFNAPRELVFKAWAEPERFAKWWGPKGFDLKVVKHDVRPGGMFLGCQTSPEGFSMWGKFVYREVQPYEKLEFVQSFSDEEGNTVRAPFNPAWPLEIMNRVELSETADGRTLLTFSGGPINASEEELQAFAQMKPHVKEGFNGTWQALDEYLAANQ